MLCSSLAKLRIIFRTTTTKIADVAALIIDRRKKYKVHVNQSVFLVILAVIGVRAVKMKVCNFAAVHKTFIMRRIFIALAMLMAFITAGAQNTEEMTQLKMTQEWDKVFPKSEKVEHEKVSFHNHFGFELAAEVYKPKNAQGRLAAVAVCGPFGAVKEQASGLYAQTLAERGFLYDQMDKILFDRITTFFNNYLK